MAARTGGLGVSIAITMTLPAAPGLSNDQCHFCGIHNLASDRISAHAASPVGGRLRAQLQILLLPTLEVSAPWQRAAFCKEPRARAGPTQGSHGSFSRRTLGQGPTQPRRPPKKPDSARVSRLMKRVLPSGIDRNPSLPCIRSIQDRSWAVL